MDFSKHIVIVTGSSRGIGKSIAYEFARCGAYVVLNGASDQNLLKRTYQEFITAGFCATFYFGDISDYCCAKEMFIHTYNTFGDYPSIVINNAGISYVGLFTDTSPEVWHKIITTNLNSAYNCAYLAAPHMISRQAGIIINISSIWGKSGASCEVAYSTSKSALNGFTKSLAKELGPSSIRVNALSCGWIDTDMNKHFSQEDLDNFIEDVPLCRIGTSIDVANACLFLASDKASYMTGQIINIDGGFL
ncbi:SDR family oxidoreductase [Cellulosilyticum sp. I15G10I2]|uniref:SDR family oxidoreductase n=1 Tax=Cellulosilyticum sp. I15G10I2 TaxID=1892843 RepID=UPI00085BEB30|nr:SDR family oxidoreductase [Cellulosilyticum sp. I15G10I2]